MSAADLVEQWRTAYTERRWADAAGLVDRLELGDLGGGDLADAAITLWMVGRPADSLDLLRRAHQAHLDAEDLEGAVDAAVWLALSLASTGSPAEAGGWAGKALGLAERLPGSSAARAMALLPGALAALEAGRVDEAEAAFTRALAITGRSRPGDAAALARLGTGQVLIVRGDCARGLPRLDEAMVAVTAGEVSPVACGLIYCAVIYCCRIAWDAARASEWTASLERWRAEQATMVAYSGQCEANRADVLRLHGRWDEALASADEAVRLTDAGDTLAQFNAHYQRGEILRLRGRLEEAAAEFDLAERSGWPAAPGTALLRLRQGRPDQALTLLARAGEAVDPLTRATYLPALVEVAVAVGDLEAAAASVAGLRAQAAEYEVPLLSATIAAAEGRVARAAGDPAGAAALLQRAVREWVALSAPYEAARCRAELAAAFAELGDGEAAARARELAREAFEQLGAAPDLAALDGRPVASGVLSAREAEVLRLVATGMTNRQVAGELVISEKTVARHLENIFAKLDVGSRSAATAWAFEHRLV